MKYPTNNDDQANEDELSGFRIRIRDSGARNSRAPSGPWVLLTDDSPTVCVMLRKLLGDIGYQTRELQNFLELPRLLRDNAPSAVVLDLERPGGLSGPAIGRFIRQYESSPIPIIVFSSLSPEVRQKICTELRAEGTVGKNESPAKLASLVRQLVGQAVVENRRGRAY